MAQGEHALIISAANAFQRQTGECGVVQIAVQTHDNVLHGLQVIGPQHHTRHGHSVDGLACRESKSIAIQLVALVVVFNRVGEVDDISGILLQRVTELHGHFFAHCSDERLGLWCRRNDNLFLLVLEVNDLVKGDFHLVAFEIDGSWLGRCLHHLRRRIITRTAFGRPDTGTCHQQHAHSKRQQPICPVLHHSRLSDKVK